MEYFIGSVPLMFLRYYMVFTYPREKGKEIGELSCQCGRCYRNLNPLPDYDWRRRINQRYYTDRYVRYIIFAGSNLCGTNSWLERGVAVTTIKPGAEFFVWRAALKGEPPFSSHSSGERIQSRETNCVATGLISRETRPFHFHKTHTHTNTHTLARAGFPPG